MNTPGQQTVAATLDAIDAATESRCACGCGRTLAVDGPSAWFASEWCQRTWAGRRVGDDSPGVDPSGGFFTAAEQAADAERYLRYAAESGHQRAMLAIASAFTPASLCLEHARQESPADPMLAAIEARRNRNTGPRPRQRAPRRIDPRRSR